MKTSDVLVLIAIAMSIGEVYAGDPLSEVTINGGKVTSATIERAKVEKNVKDTNIKAGDLFEDGEITAAKIVKGKVSGGELPVSVSLDRNNDTVKGSLSGVSLTGAELTGVIVDKAKINGVLVDLSGKTLHLTNVTLEAATIEEASLPRSEVEKPKAKPGATEAAKIALKGDYFVFKNKISGFRPSDGGSEVAAPNGACFRITQEVNPDPSDTTKAPALVRGTFVTGLFPHFLLPPYGCPSNEELEDDDIDPDLAYEVSKEKILNDRDRLRYGFTFGVLAAPFKYYPKSQTFNAGATVGPYLGYRFRDRPGESSVVALSVGMTSATVTTQNANGTSSSSTETGLSTAVVWIVDIKDQFNIGVLAGWDFFTSSSNVPNNGKPWLGISFGLKLD